MEVNSRSAAWMQGLALLAATAAIAGTLLYRQSRPFDAATLGIQVGQLQSHAAEAGLLVRQARADQLAPAFVARHAGQLADNVRRAQDRLDARPAEAPYAGAQAAARRLGAALHARLQALSDDGRAPRRGDFGFDGIAGQLDALHRQLEPAD